MIEFDLETAVRKTYEFRPDAAYSFDEVYAQYQMWNARACALERGESCFSAGELAKEGAMVVKGYLHVKTRNSQGEDVIIAAVRIGEYVGSQHVFSEEASYQYDVVAAVDSVVVYYSIEEVRKRFGDEKFKPLFNYLGTMARMKMDESIAKNAILAASKIDERLNRYFEHRIKKTSSRTIVLPGTMDEFANYLGVNRCALCRVMSRMRAEGKIEFNRNVIIVK